MEFNLLVWSANFTNAMSEFESLGKRFHVLHEDENFKGRGRELFIVIFLMPRAISNK